MAKMTQAERITEVETTLFGATRNARNGGGFIGDTRETLQIVRLGLDSIGCEVRELQASVKELAKRGRGVAKILEVTIPPLVVGLASVLAVVLAK